MSLSLFLLALFASWRFNFPLLTRVALPPLRPGWTARDRNLNRQERTNELVGEQLACSRAGTGTAVPCCAARVRRAEASSAPDFAFPSLFDHLSRFKLSRAISTPDPAGRRQAPPLLCVSSLRDLRVFAVQIVLCSPRASLASLRVTLSLATASHALHHRGSSSLPTSSRSLRLRGSNCPLQPPGAARRDRHGMPLW